LTVRRILSLVTVLYLAGSLAGVVTVQAASFDCVIDPSQKVKLASPVPGLLTNVLVKRGDFVRRNDVVAQLDSALEEATVRVEELKAGSNEEIEAQQTRLILSRNRYERAKSLAAKQYGTLDRLEQMDSEVKVGDRELALMRQRKQLAELELARSKTSLERRVILAPMDGFVLERTMGAGEFIHQEASIGTLASLDPLHVETYVPVAYWSVLKEGHHATVHLAPPVNERRTAVVSVIDRVFDIASGTFGVRLQLANPDFILPAGQRCTVDFEFNPK
jgi:RND family efflux transporter MFP subunit